MRSGGGRYVLSGSANLALLGHVSETLAGRAAYFTLHPMTRREIQGHTKKPPFITAFLKSPDASSGKVTPVSEQEVLTGGLAPVCLGTADGASEWLRGYG